MTQLTQPEVDRRKMYGTGVVQKKLPCTSEGKSISLGAETVPGPVHDSRGVVVSSRVEVRSMVLCPLFWRGHGGIVFDQIVRRLIAELGPAVTEPQHVPIIAVRGLEFGRFPRRVGDIAASLGDVDQLILEVDRPIRIILHDEPTQQVLGYYPVTRVNTLCACEARSCTGGQSSGVIANIL